MMKKLLFLIVIITMVTMIGCGTEDDPIKDSIENEDTEGDSTSDDSSTNDPDNPSDEEEDLSGDEERPEIDAELIYEINYADATAEVVGYIPNGKTYENEANVVLTIPATTIIEGREFPVVIQKVGKDYDTSLKRVIIEEGITNIGEGVFAQCIGLRSISIPKTVKSIGKNAFYECGQLATIELPSSVTEIGEYAFRSCGVTSITIPNGVTTIKEGTFFMSALTSIVLPNSITSIVGGSSVNTHSGSSVNTHKGAFQGCSKLRSLTLPNSIRRIENYTFSGCRSLQTIIIPNELTYIGEEAFAYCTSIENIQFPNSLEEIGESAFHACTFKTFTLPASNSITLRDAVFWDCKSLILVDIGGFITFDMGDNFSYNPLKNDLFAGCSQMEVILYRSKIPANISTHLSNIVCFVPDETVDIYKNIDNYYNYLSWGDCGAEIRGLSTYTPILK